MSDEEFYSEESYEFEFEDEDEDGGDFDIENNEDDSDQTGNNNNNNSNSNKSNLKRHLIISIIQQNLSKMTILSMPLLNFKR